MVAHFYYHIPRHHGKYGLAVSVYNSAEDRKSDYDECTVARRLAYMKTYKHNTPDGCDVEVQVNELTKKVLAKFPGCIFDNK